MSVSGPTGPLVEECHLGNRSTKFGKNCPSGIGEVFN